MGDRGREDGKLMQRCVIKLAITMGDWLWDPVGLPRSPLKCISGQSIRDKRGVMFFSQISSPIAQRSPQGCEPHYFWVA